MEHSFDIEHAKRHGVESAIIIKNLQFWILKNRANNKHFNDGRTWTYNSVKAFAELFPYWNGKQIARILKKLEDEKVIISGNYNKSAYDRTKWYAFYDESIYLNLENHLPKKANGKEESGEPIPDVSTDVNSDKKQYKQHFSNAGHLENFESFWGRYPRKKGKEPAKKAYTRLEKQGKLDDLNKALDNYIKEIASKKTDSNYILHGSTFLNGRWLDYVDGYEAKAESLQNRTDWEYTPDPRGLDGFI